MITAHPFPKLIILKTLTELIDSTEFQFSQLGKLVSGYVYH
jgi:hypothetical protein